MTEKLWGEGRTLAATEQDFSESGQNKKEFNYEAGRHILIVEDDVSLANFLSQELRAAYFAVDLVHDGEAALETLQGGRRYDLLILDLNLPKLDGVSLLQRVRPSKPRLPMMVLSARSRVEDKVTALRSGADDFLVKPFSFIELLA